MSLSLPGSTLNAQDLERLKGCGINAELADQARLRRVDSLEGAELIGRKGRGDYAGIAFPYMLPGENHVHTYRLRRDRPEMEQQADGTLKERAKYMSPPGSRNRMYFVPRTAESWLGDKGMLVVITEGEKKTIALWGLAWHGVGDAVEQPRWLPIGLSGVWNWIGIIGKTSGPDGDRRDVRGVISDFDRIVWAGRQVVVIFDKNVATNEGVAAARRELSRELATRGAIIRWVDLPDVAGVNGVDDLIGTWGPDKTLDLILTTAIPARTGRTAPVREGDDACVPFPGQRHNYARYLAMELRATGRSADFILPELRRKNDEWLPDPLPDGELQEIAGWAGLQSSTSLRTDLRNAYYFAGRYGHNIRWSGKEKIWVVWDGQRWTEDCKDSVALMAHSSIRDMQREAASITDGDMRVQAMKQALRSESSARIDGMIKQARVLCPCLPSDFDVDKMLLNTAGGTIDLRQGVVRGWRRQDMMRLITPVKFDPEATCPNWEKFLSEIFEPHPDLIPFIQRAVGYSLTGSTEEQCFLILHGGGANGKSTLLLVLQALLGDYAGPTAFQTFAAHKDGKNDDIAGMVGKRLIAASETEEAVTINEALIKALTGGDEMLVRHLYGKFFRFKPAFKIWLATNPLPVITGNEAAIWRRIRLVPFEVSFVGRENPKLVDTLFEELPGIMAWAMRGCETWLLDGLGRAAAVDAATASYRDESDLVRQFVAEMLVKVEGQRIRAGHLYADYKQWATERGDKPMSVAMFGRRMSRIEGVVKKEDSRGARYEGIGRRAVAPMEE